MPDNLGKEYPLFDMLCDWKMIKHSYRQTQMGYRKFRREAIVYDMARERNLVDVWRDLRNETYMPSDYTTFTVYEPKERLIQAPKIRDKVVQFAAHRVLRHVYAPVFIKDSYACQDGTRVLRGYGASSALISGGAPGAGATVGFRPALEVLNSAPLVSDLGGSLGNKSASFSLAYTVSEPDAETFTLLEQVDGTTIRNLSNQSAGNFTLNLSGVWASLATGAHTLTVTATDPGGASGVSTATFTKVNSAPPAPTYPLVSGSRIPVSGYIEFTPGADPDGDTQTPTLQHADNSSFASATSVTAGLQKWNGTGWDNVSNIPASAAGVRHRLPYSGLTLNTTRYARVNVSDGTNTTNGTTLTLKVGATLQVQTPVYNVVAMPTKVKITLAMCAIITLTTLWEYHRLDTVMGAGEITTLLAVWGGELLLIVVRQVLGSDITKKSDKEDSGE